MDKGLFQVDLAESLGVNEMTVVNWEKGRTKPAKKYFERLNQLLPEATRVLDTELGLTD